MRPDSRIRTIQMTSGKAVSSMPNFFHQQGVISSSSRPNSRSNSQARVLKNSDETRNKLKKLGKGNVAVSKHDDERQMIVASKRTKMNLLGGAKTIE